SARRKLGELSMSCRKGSTGTVNAVVPSAFSSTTSTAMIFVGMLVVWPVSGSLPIMTKGKLLVPPVPLGPINDPLKFTTETTLGTAPGGSTVMLEEAAISSFRKSIRGCIGRLGGLCIHGLQESKHRKHGKQHQGFAIEETAKGKAETCFHTLSPGGKIEPKWLGRMRGEPGSLRYVPGAAEKSTLCRRCLPPAICP